MGGLAEPVCEARRRATCVVAVGKGAVVELSSEVAGVNVGRHLSWVGACAQDAPDELVEGERFRTGQLDRVVQCAPTATSAKVLATSSAASG